MIKAYKKIGQTPLELINELRDNNPELKDQKMSYAGRLDPMAVGEMIIMVGDEENQQREKFLKHDKTYEAIVLFGFATDTYDILGLIESNNLNETGINKLDSTDLKKVLKKIKKIKKIKYPAFSSKTVQGKPLFEWKKSGRINEIDIPSREIKIKKAKLIETTEMEGIDLWNYINFSIGEVKGDFRQEEILNKWHNELQKQDSEYQLAKIKFKVSSGTYIRSLVNILGKEIGADCCLLSLKRTKVHI